MSQPAVVYVVGETLEARFAVPPFVQVPVKQPPVTPVELPEATAEARPDVSVFQKLPVIVPELIPANPAVKFEPPGMVT